MIDFIIGTFVGGFIGVALYPENKRKGGGQGCLTG
jgi:hypothetical protein